MIGRAYRLKVHCLGNDAGTVGYVFNQYPDYDYPSEWGVQIIFPNGEYDGFSYNERQNFLDYLGVDRRFVGFNFKNVGQVAKCFREGYWKW